MPLRPSLLKVPHRVESEPQSSSPAGDGGRASTGLPCGAGRRAHGRRADRRDSRSGRLPRRAPGGTQRTIRGPRLRGDRSPRRGKGSPDSGKGVPRPGEGFPRLGEGSPCWGRGFPHWGEGSPRRGKGFPHWGEGSLRQGKGVPHRGEGSPRPGGGVPHRGEGFPRAPGSQPWLWRTRQCQSSKHDLHLDALFFWGLADKTPGGPSPLLAGSAWGLPAPPGGSTARSVFSAGVGL